jgi:3-oxoacyl-(acyl-carrier-protein) synthase
MTPDSSIVITGYGSQTALGSAQADILLALKARKSGLVERTLDGCLDLWYGSARAGALASCDDSTASFAAVAVSRAIDDARLPVRAGDTGLLISIGCSKGRVRKLLGSQDPSSIVREFPGDSIGLELARHYGVAGPTVSYSAACATGLVCIIQAASMVREGLVRAAIAGSAEASGASLVMAGFRNMGALSSERMRPFSKHRSGFNPGEGAAVFILETEKDALARGVRPLARLKGWHFGSEAFHITSTSNDGSGLANSLRRTLNLAGWKAGEVDYINAHGTGTQNNDVAEARAIRAVFGADQPLVSSLKPYIGHLLGASASAELAVCLASLLGGFVPPTLGLEEPDPECALNFVPQSGCAMFPRRIVKTCLGFGGHVATMAIELLPAE